MKRLCTLEQFATDAGEKRDVSSAAIATQWVSDPEISESGRTVRYVFSTPAVGRDMHTVASRAWQLENFLRNPVFLWAHDDSQPPIGRVIEIGDENGTLRGTVEYAERDLNPFADLIYRLVRGKYLNATSTSWQPIEWSFSRDKSRPGGVDFTKVDLLEISQVPIPALPNALAEARRSLGLDTGPLYRWAERMLDTGGLTMVPRGELEQLRRSSKMSTRVKRDWKVGASKDLPIEDSDSWDGSAAEKSIFEWAGGDDFSPEKARSAFLVYNSDEPEKRESYKLPIAHAVDGELKVPKGAIRAAASRLSQTDVPDDVKKRAEKVLDHYKEKAGIGEEGDEDPKRGVRRTRPPSFRRGLYECGQLGYLLMQLGYAHSQSEFEEALEGDEDSNLPRLLGEALKSAAEAFLEMAQEEVEELLEQIDGGEDEVPEGERAFVARGTTARVRAFRRGVALLRAGRALSSANQEKLAAAHTHCERALKHHRAQGEHQEAVSGHVEELRGVHKRMSSTLADLGYDHHRVTRSLGEMSERIEELADAHADATDSHSMIGRSVKGCQRCVRAVMDGTAPIEEDDGKDPESRAARLERAQKLKLVT